MINNGLMIIIWTFGSLNYNTIFALSQYINTDILNFIMLCFVIGASQLIY